MESTTTVDKNRVEAFSDGVMAIAITLLVLGLVPPEHRPDALGAALVHQIPSYLAYAVTFVIIGIMWVNHHTMFGLLRRVDRPTLFLNLFLLGTIVTLPYPTQLLADNLNGTAADAHLAAFAYSVSMCLNAVAFSLLWWRMTRHPELLARALQPDEIRTSRRRFCFGSLVYSSCLGLSFASAPVVLGLYFAMAVYYGFDQLHAATANADANGRAEENRFGDEATDR